MSVKNKISNKRILIVDDHPMMRTGLAQLIGNEDDLKVCGEADNAAQALDAVAKQKFDLALVDISLPDKNGLELIKDIRTLKPELPILVVSMHDESLYAERVIRAGALGYITKQEATRKILVAIRRVLEGIIYLNEKIASRIISRLTAHAGAVAATPAELLSDRELQVFDLTGRGQNTKEIATRLHLAVKTIETYRARIRGKLKLKNTSELLQSAISWTHQHGTA